MLTRLLYSIVLLTTALATPPRVPSDLDHVAVPLMVEGNRPFVEVTLKNADGTTRKARFLLDTGGGGFLITEKLARELGLKWGAVSREEGSQFAVPTTTVSASIGDFPLNINPKRTFVVIGKESILPAVAPGLADGMIPGHVLSQYHVVFNYLDAAFIIAKPGALDGSGDAMPMPVSKQQGFPRTEIVVDGVTYGMLIDTGASFTMVSENVLKAWGNTHTNWERHKGAFGEATTLGGLTLETMFVPRASWGTGTVSDFGVVSQWAGTFEKYMTGMMTAPIVGSLAGNVLKHYRVDLDYPNEKLYLSDK